MVSTINPKLVAREAERFNTAFREVYDKYNPKRKGRPFPLIARDDPKMHMKHLIDVFYQRNVNGDLLRYYFEYVAQQLLDLHFQLEKDPDMVAHMKIERLGDRSNDFLFMMLMDGIGSELMPWYEKNGDTLQISEHMRKLFIEPLLRSSIRSTNQALQHCRNKNTAYYYILYVNDIPCGILIAHIYDFKLKRNAGFQVVEGKLVYVAETAKHDNPDDLLSDHKKVAYVTLVRKIGKNDHISIRGVAGQCLMDRLIADIIKAECDMVLIEPINDEVRAEYMEWGFVKACSHALAKVLYPDVEPTGDDIPIEDAFVLVSIVNGVSVRRMPPAWLLEGNDSLQEEYLTLPNLTQYKDCKHAKMLQNSIMRKCAFCVGVCNMLADLTI